MWRKVLTLAFLLWLVPVAGAEPLAVFVSVLPQKTFVERVGGGHVKVTALIRPGSNPHTYEPTPQQVAALAQAALFVRIGMPYEDAWMPRLRTANPSMMVLDGREGLPPRRVEGHDHEHEDEAEGAGADHGHSGHADRDMVDHDEAEGLDPHVWTSPPLVAVMARGIRDALTRLDPGHAADFAANQAAFAAELETLDRAIRAELAGAEGRRFLVYHPAWGYFADTYGLVQVPIEHQGKEPGARSLAALIDQARATGIRVIFVQPQLSPKAAEQVARAIGGRVEAIDPLAADYGDNLLRVARAIGAAGGP